MVFIENDMGGAMEATYGNDGIGNPFSEYFYPLHCE